MIVIRYLPKLPRAKRSFYSLTKLSTIYQRQVMLMQLASNRLLSSVCFAGSTANTTSNRRSLLALVERPHFHHSKHFCAHLCNEIATDRRTWGVGATASENQTVDFFFRELV